MASSCASSLRLKLLSLLLVVVVVARNGGTVSAAPCPYNASADLDSLLEQSAEGEFRWGETGDEYNSASPQFVYPTYKLCNEPFYEGDIFLNGMEPWANPEREPGAMIPEVQLWPGGVVYYTTANIADNSILTHLNRSIYDLESKTSTEAGPCLRFEHWYPGVSDDFLFITDSLSDCAFSGIGRHGGNQSLGMASNSISNIKHLLMHALGFWHEHNRPGRNASIEILSDNVMEGWQCFFDEYRNETEFLEDVPYDLNSVTHVPLNAWAQRGEMSMKPRTPDYDDDIGSKKVLSEQDIQRIRTKYNCSVPDTTTVSPSTTTTQPPMSTTELTTDRTTTYLPTTEQTTTRPPTTEQTTTYSPTTEQTTTYLSTTEQTTTHLPTTEQTTTHLPTTERTTTYQPPRVVCKDQPDGQLLPYTDDCHKFYKCFNGRDYVCCCPPTLVFSSEEHVCDRPGNVPCYYPDPESECFNQTVPNTQQCGYAHGSGGRSHLHEDKLPHLYSM